MTTRPHDHKTNRLKEALRGMADPALPSSATAAPDVTIQHRSASTRPPSRQGKRVVSAYIDATAAKQLRQLSADLDRSTQALVEEALNDLFRKHNRSAIA